MSSSSTPSSEYDHLFKILLIGNSAVGKSSLILQFVENSWNEIFVPTIGVDFKIKTLNIDDKRVKLQIWDTAGQERFKNITAAYYRGALGVMLVYDITDVETFKALNSWLIEIEKNANKNVVKLLVGNKIDLEEQRKITYQQGSEFAESYGMSFIETSVKNNANVNEAFEKLGREIMVLTANEKEKNIGVSNNKKKKPIDLSKQQEQIDINTNNKTNKQCC
jgi:Ras-related protein Rab-1A